MTTTKERSSSLIRHKSSIIFCAALVMLVSCTATRESIYTFAAIATVASMSELECKFYIDKVDVHVSGFSDQDPRVAAVKKACIDHFKLQSYEMTLQRNLRLAQ